MKILTLAIIPLLSIGCVSSDSGSSDKDEVIELSFYGPKKSRSELRQLEIAARGGDVEATNTLCTYYMFAGQNAKKAQYYYNLLLKAEYPPVLYDKALVLWTREEHPDVEEVLRYLTRALELGAEDKEGLLEEVMQAHETGIVPKRSRLRNFAPPAP